MERKDAYQMPALGEQSPGKGPPLALTFWAVGKANGGINVRLHADITSGKKSGQYTKYQPML